MRVFFSVLLVAVSGLHQLTVLDFECYKGSWNKTGVPYNCSTQGCCVTGMDKEDHVNWKEDCNGKSQTETCKWSQDFGIERCCCDKPLCNNETSLVWKWAMNRQECHVGTKSSSCGQTPPAPESIRCKQDQFGCLVTVEGERSAVNIKYECVEKCNQQKPCKDEPNGGHTCCCAGNNCNDKNFATAALDTFCPTTTTTTTTTTTRSFPTYAIVLIVFFIFVLILIGVGVFLYLFFVRRMWRRPKTEAPKAEAEAEPDSQLQPQMTSNVVASFVPSEFR